MSSPFFTIITATYNAAATLPCLLDSLAGQTCRDFELVIQDGGSCDDTVAVAESSRDRLPALVLASGPDSGIYDAWNKALAHARGEWILFLGADDALYSESTLAMAKDAMGSHAPGVLFACGRLDTVSSKGMLLQTLQPRINEAPKFLREGIMPVGHPALFHNRALFTENRFDINFQIAADYDFLCRALTNPAQAIDLGFTATRMEAGGVSDSLRKMHLTRWEVFRIARRHFPTDYSVCKNIIPLLKGLLLPAFCFCMGEKRAAAVLDWFRVLRGLPPIWRARGKHNG